uniref:Uncharacterized protein n=1 Tax=Anguilla anguilla TaxID=7936 RepID=A0A0E9QKT9_ANGAN
MGLPFLNPQSFLVVLLNRPRKGRPI